MRMRTITEAADYFREEDPQTALTKTAVRRLVVSGAVPSVRIGNKYLVSLEALEEYLRSPRPERSQAAAGVIRRVGDVV